MISKAMQDALNVHLKAEMYSSNLYLAMSSYCLSLNLPGFAHWMRIQSKEELIHALKFFDYLNDRGGRVQIPAVEEPPGDFKSPRGVFEETLAHEKHVTEQIHLLYEKALAEKDYATQTFLQWFISEQVEEEARVTEWVEKLRKIGESSSAIYWVDKELRKREA
jgi:ferritin